MARTRIKICGLTDPDTAVAAAEAGADAIGLNFVAGSCRQVTPEVARTIAAALPPLVTTVGVFADQPSERILAVAEEVGLDLIQLHGDESPADVARLAPRRVLKALPAGVDLAERASRYLDSDNLVGLMVDAPREGELTGGYGEAHDYGAIELPGAARLILAGGLTPDNVTAAIEAVRPWAVDVASGVEKIRGEKDLPLIEAFCLAVAAAGG